MRVLYTISGCTIDTNRTILAGLIVTVIDKARKRRSSRVDHGLYALTSYICTMHWYSEEPSLCGHTKESK